MKYSTLTAIALALAATAASGGVAKIGGIEYDTLAAAVGAAEAGDTVSITVADTYKMPGLPKNITLEGAVAGVKFDCTGSGNICSVPNGATLKNISFAMGQQNYHGWQQAGDMFFDNCTFNGKFFGYGNLTFTGCRFVQEDTDYCMWSYGSPVIKYLNCTFDCKGKAVNVYKEDDSNSFLVIADGCTFNSSVDNKPAFKINSKLVTGGFVVVTTANNTLNGFSRGISGYDSDPGEGDNAYMVTDAVLDADYKVVSGKVNRELTAALVASYVSPESAVKTLDDGTAVIGDAEPSYVISSLRSSNLFGAVKIDGKAENAFVAAAFADFGGGGRKASEVVHAANLADGDKMYVWNAEAREYAVYEVADGKWTAPDKATVTANGATIGNADLDAAVASGAGVIVRRGNTETPIYVYGEIADAEAGRETGFAAGLSLVSAPLADPSEGVDLNEAAVWTGVAAAKSGRLDVKGADFIYFRDADGEIVRWYWLDGEGWGPQPAQKPADWKGAIVPAGAAFWYRSANGGAKAAWKAAAE